MSKNRVWIAAVACFVLCFANLLFAESAPGTNPDAMVDVLKTLESKGVLTHQEFETLKQKVTAEAEAQKAAPQLRTVAMQESAEGKAMNVVSAMDSGVGFHAGRFDISFSGEVNGFLVHDRPDTSSPIACDICQVSQATRSNVGIRSGLLPSDLSVKISTQEHGWDVAVFFGIWPAIQNNNGPTGTVEGGFGGTTAVSTPGIDFRQNFATLGRPGFGTLKIGRDLGLFGQEAILNDITLLGAGTPFGNTHPGNVTLGRIGVGYIYTDFVPQVTYTTPSLHGLQGAIGVMQPYEDPFWEIASATTLGATTVGVDGGLLTGHSQPMIQGKLTYTVPTHGPVKAKVWSNFVTQKLELQNGSSQGTEVAGDSIRATGVDYGAKLNFHGLELVGYGYNTWGVGILGLLWDGIGIRADNLGPEVRPSQGWYGQLTYTAHKNTFGFSYGQSNLSPASAVDQAAMQSGLFLGVPTIRNNTSFVAQYRLAVTKWDNLVAEWIHTTSENQLFQKSESDALAFGTIVFF